MFRVYVAIQDVGGFIRTLRTFSFRKQTLSKKRLPTAKNFKLNKNSTHE